MKEVPDPPFFGLEAPHECYCGWANKLWYHYQANEKDCNKRLRNYPSGGRWRLSIYNNRGYGNGLRFIEGFEQTPVLPLQLHAGGFQMEARLII
jgi:hypothetical protein